MPNSIWRTGSLAVDGGTGGAGMAGAETVDAVSPGIEGMNMGVWSLVKYKWTRKPELTGPKPLRKMWWKSGWLRYSALMPQTACFSL